MLKLFVEFLQEKSVLSNYNHKDHKIQYSQLMQLINK